MKEIKRGDIVYVDLGQHPHSAVMSGTRPCVVVSNNKGNRCSNVLSVCPLGGKVPKKQNPVHVEIGQDDVNGYLAKRSVIYAEQAVPIDKRKVISKTGHVSNRGVLEKIDNALVLQFGLCNRKEREPA